MPDTTDRLPSALLGVAFVTPAGRTVRLAGTFPEMKKLLEALQELLDDVAVANVTDADRFSVVVHHIDRPVAILSLAAAKRGK